MSDVVVYADVRRLPDLLVGEEIPLDIDFSARMPTGQVGQMATARGLDGAGALVEGLVTTVSVPSTSVVRLWIMPTVAGTFYVEATLTCDGQAILKSRKAFKAYA
jgi:hypothetical protein